MGASNKVRVLTGKHGNKNFYKGTGSGRMGRHVFKGKSGSTYKVEEWQTRKFIAPQGEDSGLVSWGWGCRLEEEKEKEKND